MTYKVIQWATGNVGRQAVGGVVAHPDLELVGAWVHSENKVNRDVGEICGLGRLGVTATNDKDAIYQMKADCVAYAPVMPDVNEVIRLLESGKNVVTPVGWFYPFKSMDVAAIEAACRQGNATLHGTGIHPGGVTELLPLTVSGLVRNIRFVRSEEFSDIRFYNAEGVVRDIMLFGKPPEEVEKSPMVKFLAVGFFQSVDMIADTIGVTLDEEKAMHHEYALATAPIQTSFGVIEKGTAAAQRFCWEGTVNGEPVISARVNWLMGDEHLDKPWKLGKERFEVEIQGDNNIRLDIRGMHERDDEDLVNDNTLLPTAMHCVNAIPYVCRAEAGIKTYLDLPIIAGRVDQKLTAS
jgi:hypothetical protein